MDRRLHNDAATGDDDVLTRCCHASLTNDDADDMLRRGMEEKR